MRYVRFQSQAGFSLVECLVAIIILTVGLIGASYPVKGVQVSIMGMVRRTTASHLLREKLERMVFDKKTNGYAWVLEANYPDETLTGDFSPFTRTVTIDEVDRDDLSVLSPGSGYKSVNVTVSWAHPVTAQAESVSAVTLLTDEEI